MDRNSHLDLCHSRSQYLRRLVRRDSELKKKQMEENRLPDLSKVFTHWDGQQEGTKSQDSISGVHAWGRSWRFRVSGDASDFIPDESIGLSQVKVACNWNRRSFRRGRRQRWITHSRITGTRLWLQCCWRYAKRNDWNQSNGWSRRWNPITRLLSRRTQWSPISNSSNS